MIATVVQRSGILSTHAAGQGIGGFPDAPAAGSMQAPILALVPPAAAAIGEAAKPAAAGHIYHLSDGNKLASELRQQLETDGYEVKPVGTVDDLAELLVSLSPPQLVLVDTSCMSDLATVGTARRDAQKRSHSAQRIQMVVMAAEDNLRSRLDAHRAGADALLFPPFNAPEISRQLQSLMMPSVEEQMRVLIVEDDCAQALFAQSVLINAGMQVHVENDPMHVLESLKSLQPDLVLMDLHMPLANGVELTALIRALPAFMYLPIVFLSGENDPDVRFEAINSGGDDFLSKPIRPKNLIVAVQNRVRRMRALRQHQPAPDTLDDASGPKRNQPSIGAKPPSQESALIEQLRGAISNDGFELVYQPIATVQGSQEEQYQTLLRMRDADGRLVPAAEFLPLAERAGLVVEIDRWVLTHAMQVVRQQRDGGRAMRLFIPQAMATFSTADQGAWLTAELASHELSGSALVLECRLDEALLDPSGLLTFANAVRNDDVQLCLGQYEHTTDASSLLDKIPLGYIKLALKYVASNASRDVRDELHMLIDRAHKLYIQVIGHRVEDAAVAATLWMTGIDYIQGNLVQGAISALDFDFNAAVL